MTIRNSSAAQALTGLRCDSEDTSYADRADVRPRTLSGGNSLPVVSLDSLEVRLWSVLHVSPVYRELDSTLPYLSIEERIRIDLNINHAARYLRVLAVRVLD